MTAAAVTGFCRRGQCGSCDGNVRTGTGWNWWCTHDCHPEPVLDRSEYRPALDYWRKHRTVVPRL